MATIGTEISSYHMDISSKTHERAYSAGSNPAPTSRKESNGHQRSHLLGHYPRGGTLAHMALRREKEMNWGDQSEDYLPEVVDSVHRKHLAVVNEIEWTGQNIEAVWQFMQPVHEPIYANNISSLKFTNADEIVGIMTPKGLDFAFIGDFIVREGDKLMIRKGQSQRVNVLSREW